MKISHEKLVKSIENCLSDIEFTFNEKYGVITPYYKDDKFEVILCYNGDCSPKINNIKDVLNFKFIDGKSLEEMYDKIDFYFIVDD